MCESEFPGFLAPTQQKQLKFSIQGRILHKILIRCLFLFIVKKSNFVLSKAQKCRVCVRSAIKCNKAHNIDQHFPLHTTKLAS